MSSVAPVTGMAATLRTAIAARRDQADQVLACYGASNPRLFGSVARGEATDSSDIDLVVDLDPSGGNALMRVAGISEELTTLRGTQVDVVTESLLRDGVSATARRDAVPL